MDIEIKKDSKIEGYGWIDDKYIDDFSDVITPLIKRINQLEAKFRHIHVNSGINEDDSCKECGLDLRDKIHYRT